MYKYKIGFNSGVKLEFESEIKPDELLGTYFNSTGQNDKLSFGDAAIVVKNGEVSVK